MVNLNHAVRAAVHPGPNTRTLNSSTSKSSTTTSSSTSASSQSLTDELSQAFSNVLKQFGIDPSSIKLTIQTNSGSTSVQTNGTSQTSDASSPATSSKTTASAASQLGFNALVPRDPVSQQAGAAAQTYPIPAKHWYAANAADDVYWSKQPAPVQQLREIQDQGKRQVLASQLASEGYQIDNTVMVWGWDAGQVTAMRASAGYTWVPGMLQNNVTAAPGLTGPGMTPYDPSNPPSGSIAVG